MGVFIIDTDQGPIRIVEHPECWLDHGIEMLNKTPVRLKSNHRLHLTPEQSKKRKTITHYWAQLAFRERKCLATRTGDDLHRVLALIDRVREGLRVQIMALGGAPESWHWVMRDPGVDASVDEAKVKYHSGLHNKDK